MHLEETASTNNFLRDWMTKNKPIDGAVILTDKQTAGKGQAGNVWASEAGKNLTFSILYNCNFLIATKQFFLSAAIANGIRNAVAQLLPDAKVEVKWPNDI